LKQVVYFENWKKPKVAVISLYKLMPMLYLITLFELL